MFWIVRIARKETNFMSRGLLAALGAIVLAAVVGLGWMFMGGDTPSDPDTSGLPMTVTELDMPMGQADAPITVIEYSSFTCPHCQSFHLNVLPQIKTNYIDTGKVRFVFREAYFDRYGLWASLIARCGGPLRYHGIVNMVFEKQGDWVRGEPAEIEANLRKIGKLAGLSDTDLDACLTDAETADSLLAWYRGNVEAHTVEATPSFVINGAKYANMSYEGFVEAFESLLNP